MTDSSDPQDLDARERALFAGLARESAPDAASTEALVTALRREGFLRAGARRRTRWLLPLAAALALFAAGALVGNRFATRHSLERALARTDLTVADRVFLLQRAGSAYVTAAHGYADATAHADSAAVEVANQVLLGAAHAVVKSKLNSTLSSNLMNVLQAADAKPRNPILWY